MTNEPQALRNRWAIGDIQGCFTELQQLLHKIDWDPAQDALYCVGDLVNRGPDSLQVLQFLYALDQQHPGKLKLVLGNHDLHLIACFYGFRKLQAKDTLAALLAAKDCPALIEWLCQQPLVRAEADYVFCHAGIPPAWSLTDALACGADVAEALSATATRAEFLAQMYGNEPRIWDKKLRGMTRLRVITNYLTRMRFIDARGQLDFSAKESVADAPKGFKPWFSYRGATDRPIVFGHWAALQGRSNSPKHHALDTGCVWGGELTAMQLETQVRVSVPAVSLPKPLR